jgi:hypothetical protein
MKSQIRNVMAASTCLFMLGGVQAGEGKTYVTRTDEEPGRQIEIRV